MNDEQFEKFEKIAQMLRKNRGADIRVRQEQEQQDIAKIAKEEQTKEKQKNPSSSRSAFSK